MSMSESERWFAIHREEPVSARFHELIAAVHAKLEQLKLCDVAEASAGGDERTRTIYRRVASRDRHSLDELLHELARELPQQRTHAIVDQRRGDEPLQGV